MDTSGRLYTGMTGSSPEGNSKYSKKLKGCIEEAANFCLQNISQERYAPGMLLGSIQSGKTRGFIGLMALCFDNDFDMAIILTKCSKALVQQTVKRMTKEFDGFRSVNNTVGDVIAQDILEIDFTSAKTIEDKEGAVAGFLSRYKRKKRIIVVKKQAENVDRMNMFIEQLVKGTDYKRLLIIDDEADITSIGYENNREISELTLRRISGAINTARIRLNKKTQYALMQVTATPYALYLQPEAFGNEDIMPIKPASTFVMPTGEGYIGGRYYFIDSQDENSVNYNKAKYLIHIVPRDEMGIINGSEKNSSKNAKIKDKRTVKKDKFIVGYSEENDFVLESLRRWLFDTLVGAAIIQSNEGYEEYYVSAVMHAATTKAMHKEEIGLLSYGVEEIKRVLSEDINDINIKYLIKESYDDISRSVEEYGVLKLPKLEEVQNRIGRIVAGELEGLITEIDIKEINSDNDIMKQLNDDGELRLESSITIFVGGQVLDRGITIPNMINFFYGRDPKTMQQDTVVQHCRMFGYRIPELLSVTRFYTTNRLYNNMREITIRDEILRERIANQDDNSVIYLEAGGDIKPCAPAKILASDLGNIMPQKRYLPIGFELKTGKKEAVAVHKKIEDIIKANKGLLEGKNANYKKGEAPDGKYVVIDPDTTLELIRSAYDIIDPAEDGICNRYNQIEPAFLFAISELVAQGKDGVALIVRKGRSLRKLKNFGNMYQDAPDDGNNEGALATVLREKMPVLILIEQTHSDWRYNFWWPVFYTPNEMNVGIYAETTAKSSVGENLYSVPARPVKIDRFPVVDNIGTNTELTARIEERVQSIQEYYKTNFVTDGVSVDEKRKGIECNIYLEDLNPTAEEDVVKKRIGYIQSEVIRILENADVAEEDAKRIYTFLDKSLAAISNDDDIDAAFKCVEELKLKKYTEKKLIHMLELVNDLLYRGDEPFGLFIPKAHDKVEIYIYKGTMEYYLDRIGKRDEENLFALMITTIAHEMFHAFHYVDTMTESGRWLYTRQGFKKQVLVQETLAEYFCLSYAKQAHAEEEMKLAEGLVREMRDISKFPQDPYPGGLVMEAAEENGEGNKNSYYVRTYNSSLMDMLNAGKVVESLAVKK